MAEQTAPRTATQGRLEQARRDRDAFMAGPTFAFYEEWIAEEIRLIEASAAIESEAATSPVAPAVDPERLARALAKLNPPQFAEPKVSGEVNAHLRPWNPHRFTRELAAAIAREYARLQDTVDPVAT